MKEYTPYYRVSTQEQASSGLGFAVQREAVLRFVDYDESKLKGAFQEVECGKNNRREELQQAINFCKQNNTTLLIAKLDRLSRNISFIFKLRDEQVNFVCSDMPDANTLTIGIFATIAQHERELISQRTRAALLAKKAQYGEYNQKHNLREGDVGYKKLGSPQNFTQTVRDKGVAAIKEKARSNPNNQRAKGYIKTLRDKESLSFQKIADKLNKENFRTAKEKQFVPTTVMRLYKK